MATLMSRFRRTAAPDIGEARYSLEQYVADVQTMYYQGVGGGSSALNETYSGRTETIETDFPGVIAGAYKRNGIVFACQVSRLSVFAQARFAWKPIRPTVTSARLFTTAALAPVQRPWINGSEGELLARMIQDVDNAGNAYIRRQPADSMSGNLLERLRPDWVDIVLAAEPGMMNMTVVGYLYYPDGRNSGRPFEALTVDEVAHWSPYPDPTASYRGMAPLTPILREVLADNAATMHKGEFFNHAATPNMAIKFDPTIDVDKFQRFKAAMESEHAGAANAWKTLYLGGGADVTPLGMSFKEMDYRSVQGLGETRIAAAYGVPAAIAQISEGLAGSSLNAGNFSAARRLFADKTMRWLWKDCCAALERVLDVPPMSRLWWDDREVAFLREDQKDAADIQSTQASTIATLVREGFTADSVIPAVLNEDFSLLVHSGLMSVQLVPPNPDQASTDEPAASDDTDDPDDDDNGDTSDA